MKKYSFLSLLLVFSMAGSFAVPIHAQFMPRFEDLDQISEEVEYREKEEPSWISKNKWKLIAGAGLIGLLTAGTKLIHDGWKLYNIFEEHKGASFSWWNKVNAFALPQYFIDKEKIGLAPEIVAEIDGLSNNINTWLGRYTIAAIIYVVGAVPAAIEQELEQQRQMMASQKLCLALINGRTTSESFPFQFVE